MQCNAMQIPYLSTNGLCTNYTVWSLARYIIV